MQERGRKYADAEQSAQKAEQMAHGNADKETAWFMLGAIYERQKKFDQAEQEFRKVLERESEQRFGAELLRLHAGGSRRSAGRSDFADPARGEAGAEQRRLSRQPGLGLLQAEQT